MQEIDYTFDAVNNITGISNSAGMLNNGLGGTYNHNYSYDNSYRLISSNGLWDNNNNSLDYQLNLVYSRDGRILTKAQSATTLIGGMLSNFSYDNEYKYNTNQPHTVKEIVDFQNHGDQYFNWDANGNLTYQHHKLNGERKLCWDEENRLMAVGNDNYTSYYIYDNSGERTYKLAGLNTLMNINGRWVNFATMDNPTLYTSAYLVAGVQGYTKHYYAGSERVSSAIGLGGLENINDPLPIEFGGSWDEKSGSLMEEMNRTIVECLKNDYNIATSLHFLHGMTSPTAGTMDRYFYHPDHLGSSSWITDGSGNAIQHLHYLPFGEDWVDQRNASWSAPYTFSGKEKDVETGYSYFGARYYDSGLSIWLSVDPMSDKYPHQTNYVYCSNNPIMLIDPNGEDEYKFDGVGNLKNVKSTPHDSFHKIDENGNITASKYFDRKIVSFEFEIEGIEGKTWNSNYLQIDNGNDADEVFSFLADQVEWEGGEFSISYVQDSQGKYTNLIGADAPAVSGCNYSTLNLLNCKEYDVISSTHNHRFGASDPSVEDLFYPFYYPNTKFYIYTSDKFCTPFDQFTPPAEINKIKFIYPEIEVKPN